MSVEIPVPEERQSLPHRVLTELNIILDERTPLTLRAALLVKWLSFFNAITRGRIEVPRYEELTPRKIREYAEKLTALVAQFFYKKDELAEILNQADIQHQI
jgi:hypothetical protein